MVFRTAKQSSMSVLVVASFWFVTAWAAENATERDKKAEALFSNRNPVSHLRIEVSSSDMDLLLRESRSARSRGPRAEVSATVREGTNIYSRVAVHLKGSGGSFQPVDEKPALTLHFDEHVKGQRFHGLEKISLNNSVQDPSFLCEHIGRKLFVAAGIPAPRVTHATVALNGRPLGLYVLVEGWNQQFLHRHFSDTKGNFYEPAFRVDVPGPFEVKSGAAPEDHRALEALEAAVREPDAERRWAALERTLDVDRFITGMALEILLNHWDGYCRARNNYRLFHDRASNRIVFLPHGLDQLFALRRPENDTPLAPPMRGSVAAAVMTTSEGRLRYFDRTGWLLTNVFNVADLTDDVRKMAVRLRPVLENERGRESFDARVLRLEERIAERHVTAWEQYVAATTPMRFVGASPVLLKNWQFWRNEGGRDFDRRNSGAEFLEINANGRNGRGVWRTTVLLEPGRYRFEGRAHVLPNSPRDTANPAAILLHTSAGGSIRRRNEGGAINITNEFIVHKKRHIDLSCDSNVATGRTVFEPSSLKLSRVPQTP